MRWRPERGQLALWSTALLIWGLLLGPAWAAPGAPSPATPPAARTVPDYGGRDAPGGLAPASATEAAGPLNPLAQAGRALEALVIVLALVVVVVYGLKRLGIVGPVSGGRLHFGLPPPAVRSSTDGLRVLSSHALPGTPGAAVHLLSVADRTLLVGATAQSVTLLTEWDAEQAEPSTDAFDSYLARQEIAPDVLESTLRDAEDRVARAADSLQSLLARRSGEGEHNA